MNHEVEVEVKSEWPLSGEPSLAIECDVCGERATRTVDFGEVQNNYGSGDEIDLCPEKGCNSVRKLTGLDRHDAEHVDVPVSTGIIRQLPATEGITFSPDYIAGAPAKVRVFVKNDYWLTASPGMWYEIPWAVAVDTRTTEYAVIDFVSQGARVYNQPSVSPRAIIVESVPVGANDPGRPSQ